MTRSLFKLMPFILSVFTFFSSCTSLSPKEKELRNALSQTLQLEMVQTVQLGDSTLTYTEFRERFKFLSIIYLQNQCAPCYPKFIEWKKNVELIALPPNYNVLFVIQYETYSQFIEEVNTYAWDNLGIDNIETFPPIIIDPNLDFLFSNHNIPSWIIDRSVLIDSLNRIRLVGAPWATPEMTKLFHRICSENEDN